ncbi:testis secretory pathway calcium transporting ATPase [Ectocarpus siliculosus]|uniref:Calcium-transporting ATPase n=1 Tax=Ectocarpus siliculosus TaxID=2880 RepID=D7FSN6_ECTSI|nr:testis secretory pathway calcium transporting ATPase [Ectocarpus siliculosus]|eukprot:CBJ31177.1 testis secretory pathway calcium transporting ATPase [Ectocarpus siliculosus]
MDTDSAARLAPEEVGRHLGVDVQSGLSLLEVSVRQGLVPPNELEKEEEDPLYKRYLEQFKDPLILLLLGSAVLSLLIKQYDDAVSIFMAVTIVATVAFVQEYRSEQSLQALTTLLPPHATCFRGGKASDVMARELVPGDVVLVKSGDRIPADCRLVQAADLFVDESSLTGEGHAREKVTAALGAVASGDGRLEGAGPVSHGHRAIPLAECKNMVFMGTLACGGHAKAIVVATGMKTEFGKTFEDMKDIESRRTPLQMKMDELGKQLSLLSFGIIGVIALVGVLQGKKLLDMFNIGVSLAVAAIPEGLPICVTVTLALGVMRMAKRNAIVKRLPAVEALGCATVICADKTGTLTRNKMTVKEVFVLSEEEVLAVGGVGYDPAGEFTVCGRGVTPQSCPAVASLLEAACLCNNAALGDAAAGGARVSSADPVAADDAATRGQPTEICLLVAAQKFGVPDPRPTHERIHEVAFSSSRKKMEVRCLDSAGKETCYVKGSVEAVLINCTTCQVQRGSAAAEMGETERRRVLDVANALGSKGRRVMAVACGTRADSLFFCGLVGIMDPPRASAIKFAERMQACSTRMCMITGDAEDTAVAVASAVGFFDPSHHRTLSGAEIESMSTSELEVFVHEVGVFYRTSPRHKLSIVKALQGIGEVVVMTGDGVNDAPALKAADIGVAMGISGSDVAKEAADMILMDDDIATITAAIEEGKAIFYNIKNFLTFQLSTALAALSIVAIATCMGFKCPINAMQILWINIIMDGPPAQSLGVEPVHGAIVKRPPRKAGDPVISTRLMWRVVTSGCLIVVGTLWVFSLGMTQNGVLSRSMEPTRRDRTMTFTTFVMFDMFNALCCRSADKIVPQMDMFANKAFIYSAGGSLVGQMLVVYVPWLQQIFQTEALSLNDLAFIVFVASSMVALDTARKVLFPDRQGEAPVWAGSALTRSLGREKLSMA